MKGFNYIVILFFSLGLLNAQEQLTAVLISKTPFNNQFISVDNFDATYTLKNNTLLKTTGTTQLNYNNFQLGEITQTDTFNPLKIVVFFASFNTTVILDNRLSEIFKIDFNTLPLYRDVSLVSNGYDNSLWLFNNNTQQLELFDYKNLKTKTTTLPLSEKPISITSNYNSCWLLTEEFIYLYNYTGSLLKKIPNTGFTKIKNNNKFLFLQKENELYYLSQETKTPQLITLPKLLLKEFSVINETLYIYNSNLLYKFQLKTN